MTAQNHEFTVIGAGMVGVCCALYLQNEGFRVTIVERAQPGAGASSGNLGNFGIASCPPMATPGILKQVPGMLLDPGSPLKIRWNHLPASLPWFLRLLANSRKKRVEEIARVRQRLIDNVHDALNPLVAEAGAESLLKQAGLLFTFESEEAFQNSSYVFQLRTSNGVKMELLDGGEARQCEPALSQKVVRAWWVPDLVHTSDPEALVKALATLFTARGGEFQQCTVQGFNFGPEGVRALRTSEGSMKAENVVIAAGAWSKPLAKALGTTVPLTAERGYHTEFTDSNIEIRVPVISAERRIAVTQMRRGVRAGGFAEFAAPDAPPNMQLAHMARRHAEELFPSLQSATHSVWMGPRPSMPDSIPVIGRAPRCRNAWFAFGHDHLGLTFGAVTGKIISEMVAGKTACVDSSHFRPERFNMFSRG